jgi:hypothetical protein
MFAGTWLAVVAICIDVMHPVPNFLFCVTINGNKISALEQT